ncbi:hypothetical protein RKD38_004575 [Streptomyces ambofaciens]
MCGPSGHSSRPVPTVTDPQPIPVLTETHQRSARLRSPHGRLHSVRRTAAARPPRGPARVRHWRGSRGSRRRPRAARPRSAGRGPGTGRPCRLLLAAALRPAAAAHHPRAVGAARPADAAPLRTVGGPGRRGAVPGEVRRVPPPGDRHRSGGLPRRAGAGRHRLAAARLRGPGADRRRGGGRHRLQPHPARAGLARPRHLHRRVPARRRVPRPGPVRRPGRPGGRGGQHRRRDRRGPGGGRGRPGPARGAHGAAHRPPLDRRVGRAVHRHPVPAAAGRAGGPAGPAAGPAQRPRPVGTGAAASRHRALQPGGRGCHPGAGRGPDRRGALGPGGDRRRDGRLRGRQGPPGRRHPHRPRRGDRGHGVPAEPGGPGRTSRRPRRHRPPDHPRGPAPRPPHPACTSPASPTPSAACCANSPSTPDGSRARWRSGRRDGCPGCRVSRGARCVPLPTLDRTLRPVQAAAATGAGRRRITRAIRAAAAHRAPEAIHTTS